MKDKILQQTAQINSSRLHANQIVGVIMEPLNYLIIYLESSLSHANCVKLEQKSCFCQEILHHVKKTLYFLLLLVFLKPGT